MEYYRLSFRFVPFIYRKTLANKRLLYSVAIVYGKLICYIGIRCDRHRLASMVIGRQQRRRVVAEQRRMVADQRRRMADVRGRRMIRGMVGGRRMIRGIGGRRMVRGMIGGRVRNDRLMVTDRADVVRRRADQRRMTDQRRMVHNGGRMVDDGRRRSNVRVRDERLRMAVAEAEQAALGFCCFGGDRSRRSHRCDSVQRCGFFGGTGNGGGIGERTDDQQDDGEADNLRAQWKRFSTESHAKCGRGLT